MNFTSIEDIISHFNINSNEQDDIKSYLKEIRKKLHPDNSNGEFLSKEEEAKYYDVQSALSFLDDNISTIALAKTKEIVALTNALALLNKNKEDEKIQEKITKSNSDLTEHISNSISIFKKKQIKFKVTNAIVATTITTIWLFPNLAKNHPILSAIYQNSEKFTVLWVLTLAICGILWVVSRIRESNDEEIKTNYRLELTQNQIFNLFINWQESNYKATNRDDGKSEFKFSKDDLLNFITDRYRNLDTFIREFRHLSKYKLQEEIHRFEEMSRLGRNIREIDRNPMQSFFDKIFPIPGEINLETAHLLTELIVNRLIEKEAITKTQEKRLSDTYIYIQD